MSGIRLIPNQSVAIARTRTGFCPDDPDYCQPVASDQITQAQFEPLLVNGANLIADANFQSSTFWNSPSGFVPQTGGGALVTATSAGPLVSLNWQPTLTTLGNFYKITFTYRIDQLDDAAQINAVTNVDSIGTVFTINLGQKVIGVEYTQVAYFFHDTTISPSTNQSLSFTLTNPPTGSAIVFFKNIQIQLLAFKDVVFEVQDCEGNVVETLATYLQFIADSTLRNYVYIPRADTAGYAPYFVAHIDWDEFDNGCYKLCWRYSDIQSECSECFDKGCNVPLLTLTYSNNEPAFGMWYRSNGSPANQISFVASLGKSNYPDELSDQYLFGNGQRITTFVHTRKIFTLSTLRMPEYMHDAIRVALLHENLTINAEAFHKISGAYSPNWENDSLLASVEVEVEQKTQNTFGAIA